MVINYDFNFNGHYVNGTINDNIMTMYIDDVIIISGLNLNKDEIFVMIARKERELLEFVGLVYNMSKTGLIPFFHLSRYKSFDDFAEDFTKYRLSAGDLLDEIL